MKLRNVLSHKLFHTRAGSTTEFRYIPQYVTDFGMEVLVECVEVSLAQGASR